MAFVCFLLELEREFMRWSHENCDAQAPNEEPITPKWEVKQERCLLAIIYWSGTSNHNGKNLSVNKFLKIQSYSHLPFILSIYIYHHHYQCIKQ